MLSPLKNGWILSFAFSAIGMLMMPAVTKAVCEYGNCYDFSGVCPPGYYVDRQYQGSYYDVSCGYEETCYHFYCEAHIDDENGLVCGGDNIYQCSFF